MGIFTRKHCAVCGKQKLFVRCRSYQVKRLGRVTSKNEICESCHRVGKREVRLANEAIE